MLFQFSRSFVVMVSTTVLSAVISSAKTSFRRSRVRWLKACPKMWYVRSFLGVCAESSGKILPAYSKRGSRIMNGLFFMEYRIVFFGRRGGWLS